MKEAKFLVDDAPPPPSSRGQVGTLFNLKWHRHIKIRFSAAFFSCLLVVFLGVLLSTIDLTRQQQQWGVLCFLIGSLLAVWYARRYDWIGRLSRHFFTLMHWFTKTWLSSAKGGQKEDDQHRFSNQVKDALSSGWFLALGIGPAFFALIAAGLAWVSPMVALGASAVALVGATGTALLSSDQEAIASMPNEGAAERLWVDASSPESDETIVDDSDDEKDEIAVPFAKPSNEDITASMQKDKDAAIEGIDPTLSAASDVDLAASNQQVLHQVEDTQVPVHALHQAVTPRDNNELDALPLQESTPAVPSGVN